jgi:hypothetical protein
VVLTKNRYEDQWDRIEGRDMNLCTYAHLIFDKGAKYMWERKESRFNKCCCENWISTSRKLKLDPCLSLCTSINSKWINNLNMRLYTLMLVRKEQGIY